MGSFYIGSNKVCPAIMPSTSGASIPLEVSAQGVLQKPETSFTWSLPSNVTDIGIYCLYYAFYGCVGLTSVDLSSLTTMSGSNAMYYAFPYCSNLTSVDLSSLTTISGSAAMYYAFPYCTSLTSLSFPALTSTSFGSYTNQFNNMLSGVTGCTVHFPSNLQSVIGSWSSVTAGFGGTNTTVLFDLPSTEGNSVVNLTVRLYGNRIYSYFTGFTINNTTYTYSDFTDNEMTISIPKNTNLSWTATNSAVTPEPSSGTINASQDTDLTIYMNSGEGDKE